MDQDEKPWHLTIVLLEGLRLMRPEKAWRPIVTVEIDKHIVHETTLGVDGQNINQKDVFKFHGAGHSSKIDISVWHRSHSKKKKRKILVASASHCLGELLKKQDLGPTTVELDVGLQCRTATRQSGGSSRGRPQKGASLRLKIKPPSTLTEQSDDSEQGSSRRNLLWTKGSESDTDDSCSVATDQGINNLPEPTALPQQTIRRRIKGYIINTDDEDCDDTDEDYPPEIPSYRDDETCYKDEDDDEFLNAMNYRPSLTSNGEIIRFDSVEGGFMAFSDIPLPLYTEKITMAPDRNVVQRILASLTMYGDLSMAVNEDQFAAVFIRLQHEWTFIGGLLVALAAVDTAVFSISPDSIFTVDSYAKAAIATSSVASGLGIACDAWFLLRYNWADLRTFIIRAKDLYDSYFFFSLSARVPAFCMFISALSLMGFLAVVAFDAWPQGVIGISFLVGVIMSMQFLVYGAHWCANRVAEGGRASGRGVVTVVRVVKRTISMSA